MSPSSGMDESLGLVVCLVASESPKSGSSAVEVLRAPNLRLWPVRAWGA